MYPHQVFCLAMFTQTFDLVLNRTVSSRRLSCVPSTCVLPGRVTFYYCLGDEYSLIWLKICLPINLNWSSKEPSRRDNVLVLPKHMFCLLEQLCITALMMITACFGLSYDYPNI